MAAADDTARQAVVRSLLQQHAWADEALLQAVLEGSGWSLEDASNMLADMASAPVLPGDGNGRASTLLIEPMPSPQGIDGQDIIQEPGTPAQPLAEV